MHGVPCSFLSVAGTRYCADGQDCPCKGTIYFGRKWVNGPAPGDENGPQTDLDKMRQTAQFTSAISDNSRQCSNDAFGDPAEGWYKHCICDPSMLLRQQKEALQHCGKEGLGGGGFGGMRASRKSPGVGPTLPRCAIPQASQAAPHPHFLNLDFPMYLAPLFVVRSILCTVVLVPAYGLHLESRGLSRAPKTRNQIGSNCCPTTPGHPGFPVAPGGAVGAGGGGETV